MRNEWEGLKKHDIIFLLTIRPKLAYGTPFESKVNFLHQYGVESVRGVEVEGYLDNEGRVIEDWIEKEQNLKIIIFGKKDFRNLENDQVRKFPN